MPAPPPELKIYRETTLSLPYYYQAQAFSRIVWGDGDDYDIDQWRDTRETHVVVARGNQLIAYAGVILTRIDHAGQSYRCYGLSGVMTFPAFRRRGYGGQVVGAATGLMREDATADFGLLWTAPGNEQFYARHGWVMLPEMVTLVGDPAQPTVYDEEPAMMLFLSEKAKENRAAFERGRVYVGPESW